MLEMKRQHPTEIGKMKWEEKQDKPAIGPFLWT